MSDEWQVGDLAECIRRGPPWKRMDKTPGEFPGPKRGDIIRVSRVAMIQGYHSLMFEEWSQHFYISKHFRKVQPPKHEDCEPEFVSLLESFKVKKPVKIKHPEHEDA